MSGSTTTTGDGTGTPGGAPPVGGTPTARAPSLAVVPAAVAPAAPVVVTPMAADHPNPFRAIALLMKSIADSLENPSSTGRPPRYVRVARLRNFLVPVVPTDETVAKAIAEGVRYFITAMGFIQKYSLKAEALLTQGDAGKALFETAADLLDTVADPEFFNSLSAVVDGPQMDSSPLQGMKGVVSTARKIVDRI